MKESIEDFVKWLISSGIDFYEGLELATRKGYTELEFVKTWPANR